MSKPQYTPMIEQYLKIKQENKDSIVFFRLGDFYEMFFDDAVIASRELEITLTGRDGGNKEKIPMCGVPYHAADNYVLKLINRGYRVAICEQTEDASQTKNIVRREVVRVITPGTLISGAMLAESKSNQLVAVSKQNDDIYILSCDVSVGECCWLYFSEPYSKSDIFSAIYHFQPAEILLVSELDIEDDFWKLINNYLPNCMISNMHLQDNNEGAYWRKKNFGKIDDSSLEIVLEKFLSYIAYTLKCDIGHINKITNYAIDLYLYLDANTLRNLEITSNLRDNGRNNSLLQILDYTQTAMGGRMLKNWLEFPLARKDLIIERQNCLSELIQSATVKLTIRKLLREIYDFARILSRVETGVANARDLLALSKSLAVVPSLKECIGRFSAKLFLQLFSNTFPHEDLNIELSRALNENLPLSIREGNIIRDGYSLELDELRQISLNSKSWIVEYERTLRVQSNIKSLKVGYNRVFGYYIEITNANKDLVPLNFIRKQTLANAERYITPELKEYEVKVLGAEQQINIIEYQLFNELIKKVRDNLLDLQTTARSIATIDCLCSLAWAAEENNYCCPEFNDEKHIKINEGRHPVVERLLARGNFVPNDTSLNHSDSELLLITGPNMGGKSTYMRQVALVCIMAQCGSFVPAEYASLCLVDRIFTRIGASDDLAAGQSTFMSEMIEVANILHNATTDSLIIFDEVGRGTSTYDGMSIAKAVVEYVQTHIKAKTLFATHYHELTCLEDSWNKVKNYSVAVSEENGNVIFLKRIVEGKADKSYGIHVAELAGLPDLVIGNARAVLESIEICSDNLLHNLQWQESFGTNEESNIAVRDEYRVLVRELASVDINNITPMQAIQLLANINKKANMLMQ